MKTEQKLPKFTHIFAGILNMNFHNKRIISTKTETNKYKNSKNQIVEYQHPLERDFQQNLINTNLYSSAPAYKISFNYQH